MPFIGRSHMRSHMPPHPHVQSFCCTKTPPKSALKSMFGTVQDVQDCYIEEVGFLEGCAKCWTFDSLCSKKYCTFIFLQSVIINNAGNFAVGPDDITSATCEEAMCGEEYAPCKNFVCVSLCRLRCISSLRSTDEARSYFVSLSSFNLSILGAGATRRRMNIESDIERPEFQQCSVAEEDWAEVFDSP